MKPSPRASRYGAHPSLRPTRRRFLQLAPAAGLAAGTLLGGGLVGCEGRSAAIKVGILHSLSGDMGMSEAPLRDAEILAIEEINAAGGVLGRRVLPITEDPASDLGRFRERSEVLLKNDKVCSVFGCWTSASRKAVLPVFERHNGLLWYPVQYEGNECSRNVIYTGSTPHQQVLPAVQWLLALGRRRFYLIGSDYVYPRTANLIVKEYVARHGGEIAGEEYRPLGERDFRSAVLRIRAARPDVVLSTVNGGSNSYFYQQYYNAGLRASEVPILATSIAEVEIRYISPTVTTGHYAAWAYFQSVDSGENHTFVRKFKARYGDMRVVDDPIEAAYVQVHFWAQAVAKAGSTRVDAIRAAAAGQAYDAPEGRIHIDAVNRHTWKMFRIGRIREDGQFDIVYSSPQALPPLPWDHSVEVGLACDWNTGQILKR